MIICQNCEYERDACDCYVSFGHAIDAVWDISDSFWDVIWERVDGFVGWQEYQMGVSDACQDTHNEIENENENRKGVQSHDENENGSWH